MRHGLLFLVFALGALGCSSEPFKVAPVSGKVTLDGRPLADADVYFQPMGAGQLNPGPGSFAKTNERGEFTLRLQFDGPPRQGAVVGKHRVTISKPLGPRPAPPDDKPYEFKNQVPAKYNTQSNLEFEVPAKGSDTAHFELKSR